MGPKIPCPACVPLRKIAWDRANAGHSMRLDLESSSKARVVAGGMCRF